MKIFLYLFLILCAVFMGMELGVPANGFPGKELSENISDFEDQIQDPNNNYKPGQDNIRIHPNISNDIAKTGENAVTGIFEYTLRLLESFVTKK